MNAQGHGQIPGYSLLERIGEGATGVVYKSQQASTGQLVAIKLLRFGKMTTPASQARLMARFGRELKLCARLHHPHIVRLLDRGETASGEAFAVFEYVPGETLRDLLLRRVALKAPEAGELMGQVLDALVAAHAQSIVHRDLKPLNIMVSRSGAQSQAKVLDFGIGTIAADLERLEPRELTLTSELLGTPRYSAPEQLRGEPPTVKSDLYSWSLMLLECLTGVPVVGGSTLAQIYYDHLSPTEVPLPLALLRHPLGKLLRRTLSKNPRERAGSTADLFASYRQINFESIVGNLRDDATLAIDGGAATVVDAELVAERRQITMLCYSLELLPTAAGSIALEASDELLHDQLLMCTETCLASGGYLAGALGAGRLMYFGYPQANDMAGRSAATAALELVSQVRQRSRGLEQRHGLRLQIRASIHAGVFIVRGPHTPSGRVVSVARKLEELARPGSITVSERARNLLDPHFTLEPLGLTVMIEDGREAPAFSLMAQRARGATKLSYDGHEPAELFGRATELAQVRDAWEQALGGASCARALIGEPGIGKSRLARELCNHVVDSGRQAWVLQCAREEQNSALRPFLDWLRSLLAVDGAQDGPTAAPGLVNLLSSLNFDSTDIAPLLCSWLGLPLPAAFRPAPHGPNRQKQIVLDVLCALIDQRAQGPLLLVLEDVQWVDPTTRELVEQLLAAKRGHGLFVLLTARPEYEAFPQVTRVPLTGLEPPDAEALLRSLLPQSGRVGNMVQDLAARGDGNPLYLSELAYARLEPATGERELRQGAGPAREIPESLHDLLNQALERLGTARLTAQRAAVLGREFDASMLIQSSSFDPADVQRDVEHMISVGLLQRQRRVQGDRLAFRHALLRDAAYDSMTDGVREQAHARVVDMLEADEAASTPALLAQHSAGAGRFDRAVSCGIESARLALSRGLHVEARGQAESVRGWLAKMDVAQRELSELDLNLVVTQALMSEYGWADTRVRDAAERSRELLEGVDDEERRGAALWALATYHHVAGDRERVRTIAQQLIELSGRVSSPALTRAAYTIRGMCYWIDGHYPQAADCFERVRAEPVAPDGQDAAQFGLDCRCWSLVALANVRWFLDGDEQAALALASDGVTAAETLNHIPTLGIALMYTAFLHHYADDRASARLVCERLLALSRRFGLPAVEAYCGIIDCWVRDDYGTASAILQALDRIGCRLGLTYFSSMRGDSAARTGDLGSALADLDQCLELAVSMGERYYEAELLRKKASLLLSRGDAESTRVAEVLLRQCLASAAASGMSHTQRRVSAQLATLESSTKSTEAPPGCQPALS
jgi:TOMM system kinase/cyclase fusion protein